MSEKMREVYEAYDMEIQGVGRGRGAIVLTTDKGVRQISPLLGSELRLAQEKDFKDKLVNAGFPYVETVVENKEGELFSVDRYGNAFVCREYFQGRECSPTCLRDMEKAAINLARFHQISREIYEDATCRLPEKRGIHLPEESTSQSLDDSKRQLPEDGKSDQIKSRLSGDKKDREPGNLPSKARELRRIKNFMEKRSVKSDFELTYMRNYDYFYNQAAECLEMFKKNFVGSPRWNGYCHGTYNHHSVTFCDGFIATINFDRFHEGYQLMDLYQFLRKAMEKNGYDIQMFADILGAYSQIQPLEKEDYEFIYIMYSFPEKFWKIGNRYMNRRKSYISPVLMEKLAKVIEDDQEKKKILREISCFYGLHKLTK